LSGLAAWINDNWLIIVVPVAVLVASIIATLWLRRAIYRIISNRLSNLKWPAQTLLIPSIRTPSILWCLFISLPIEVKVPITNALWTVLLASMALTVYNILNNFLTYYAPRIQLSTNVITLVRNIIRFTVLIVAALIGLEIWGIPTMPVTVLIALLVLALVISLRDVFPNLIAGFQMNAAGQLKVGDYVRLESGEEGYIVAVDWRSTRLKTLDDKFVIVPNTRLTSSPVVNYGRPLKKAKDPFQFHSRIHLTELTGLRVSTLHQFLEILRSAPDAVVNYHTHHFLEEHNFLTPEPSNDFALWVEEAIGDAALAEQLASVDAFNFSDLMSLRDRFVGIIDEHLTPEHYDHEVMPGKEFHFMKSTSAVFSIPYVAHDLREFAEALRGISTNSIYYHIFESRLRLGKGMNDFTIWLKESLDEAELGEQISRLDPYTYTLEGLRSLLIQMIEKRIK